MLEGYLIYYIITNGNFKIEKSDFINISKIATFIMLTLSAEIIFKYFHYGFANVFSPDGSSKYMVDIGWGYSNLIAVIFLFSIPVALYKYLDKSHYYIGYLFLDLLNLLGLFLTQSRGAYLGAFLSIILFIIFYVRFDFIKKYGSIIALLLIGTFIIPQTREIILHILQKFVNPETFFNVRTDTERIAVLEVGIRKFFDNPIFGTGLKSSRYYIAEIGRERYHYHNFLLQIISTLGVVGFILFIGVVKRVVKVLNKRKEPFIMCITFALVGSLTHQMVDISFDYYYFGLYFYTLIGIVEIYRHHLKDDSVKLKVYNLNDNK
jgi:O-antigen ligase